MPGQIEVQLTVVITDPHIHMLGERYWKPLGPPIPAAVRQFKHSVVEIPMYRANEKLAKRQCTDLCYKSLRRSWPKEEGKEGGIKTHHETRQSAGPLRVF